MQRVFDELAREFSHVGTTVIAAARRCRLRILEAQGLELVDRQPREGLSGNVAFIHPRSVFGILTELVESRG